MLNSVVLLLLFVHRLSSSVCFLWEYSHPPVQSLSATPFCAKKTSKRSSLDIMTATATATTTRQHFTRRRMVRRRQRPHDDSQHNHGYRSVAISSTPSCSAASCASSSSSSSSSSSKLSSSACLLLLLALSNTMITQTSATYQYQNPYANNNNGYSGYSSSSGGGVAYSYGGSQQKMAMNVCKDSVVQVNKVEWSCDSPYTWYYGSGAHRNSATCDYGDKMTMTIKFQVVANIDEASVNDIFATMAIYDDAENLLSYTSPDYLCKNLVSNTQCTYAGTYSFTTKLTLSRPNSEDMEVSDSTSNSNYYGYGSDASSSSSSSSSTSSYYHGKVNNFYPVLQMAFSTKQDSGYNLGALNVECKEWNEQYPSYVAWSNQPSKTRTREILATYGLLMGTSLLLVAIIAFVWKQAADAKRQQRRGVELFGGGSYYNSNLSYQQFDDSSTLLQNYQYSRQPLPMPQPSLHHVPAPPPISGSGAGAGALVAIYSTTSSASVGGTTGAAAGAAATTTTDDNFATSSFLKAPLSASLSSLSRQRQQEKLEEQEYHQIT
jgi:hypothetical protein